MQYNFTPTEKITFDYETSFAGDTFTHEKEITLNDTENGLEIDIKAYFEESCTYFMSATQETPNEFKGNFRFSELEIEAWYKGNLLQENLIPADIFKALEKEMTNLNEDW